MKYTNKIFLLMMLLPLGLVAKKPQADTIIIEPNGKTKIIIYANSKEDLRKLQNYDINQMVRDIINEVSESTERIDIQQNKEIYVSGLRIEGDVVRLRVGGKSVEVKPEMKDFNDDLDNNPNVSYYKKTYITETTKRTSHHFTIDFGINNWLDSGKFPNSENKPYAVKPWGSWYVGLNATNRTKLASVLTLEWALGVDWYNWKLENPNYVIVEKDDRVAFEKIPSNATGIKSKLTAAYINLKLVPMLDFSKGKVKRKEIFSNNIKITNNSRQSFRIGVGGYAGYRIGSHSKLISQVKNDKNKEKKRDNFYLADLKYGLRGQIGWKGVDFFVNYDLNNVFVNGKGPEGSKGLNAVSFGLIF